MVNSIKFTFILLSSIFIEYVCYIHITEDTTKLRDNKTTTHKVTILNKPSEKKDNFDVILMCGWDERKGKRYLTCESQSSMFSEGLLGSKNVVSIKYDEINETLKLISENPNAYVVLFSAGGKYSETIARVIKDKSKLYILQPAHRNAVQGAVLLGVPAKNIIEGNTTGTGNSFVDGATKTPKGYSHFGSLKFAASLLN